MTTRASSALTSPRDDIGLFFEAIDLESIRRGYIGFQVAPVIESPFAFGKYSYRDVKSVLKKTDAKRTAEGGFNRISSQFSTNSFQVQQRGLEEQVDYFTAQSNIGLVDSELVAAEATRHGVLEDHEMQVIDKINALTATTTLSTSTDKWSHDSSDPVDQFVTYIRNFRLNCGHRPTSLLIDQTVVDCLGKNPAVLEAAGHAGSNFADALRYNAGREVKKAAIAAALGIGEIIESGGIRNTARDPLAASLVTTLTETDAVLFIRDMGPSTRNVQWLRTVHWSGNGSRVGCAFEQYEEPQTDSTVIRHRMDSTIIEVNSEAVMLIDGVIDTSAL